MDTIPQDIPQKQCTGECKQLLPATVEFFDRKKHGKYGLREQCKQCRKEERRRPEIQEYQRAYNKAYRNSHPELRDLKRAYFSRPDIKERTSTHHKEYYRRPEVHARILAREKAYQSRPEIQERLRACRKSYYSRWEIQERARARTKAWNHNPENYERIRTRSKAYNSSQEGHAKIMANVRNRKARKRAIPGTLTSEQIQHKLRMQRFRCYYCAIKFEKQNEKYVYHLDHTIPIARKEAQPRHDMSHTVLACPSCNLSKNSKLPHEWFEGGRLL